MGSDPYIELFVLASGGMGTVSLAVRSQGGFERLYAMKRLKPHMAEEPAIREMFLTEAQYAGLLRHPNVVSVLDFGTDSVGPFLIMDWIEGVPLHRFIAQATREGPIPATLVFRVCAQIARGLHAAHELRTHAGQEMELVHRDVTPQNILLGFDGLVRVTDFGIAKALGSSETKATTTGILKGKMGYLSPEQLRFEAADRRSDLFSLGVVLFEMLSGKRLYSSKGSELSVPQQILHAPPPCIRDVRRDVSPLAEELLLELLSKQPADRPASAKEVAERLEELVEQESESGTSGALSAYLDAQFGTEREEMRVRIADALQSRGTAPHAPRRRIALVAAIALVVTLGALGAFVATRERASTARVVAPLSSAVPPPAVAEPVSVEPRPAEASEEAPAPARPSTRPRRTRPRARDRATPPAKANVPRPGEGGWN